MKLTGILTAVLGIVLLGSGSAFGRNFIRGDVDGDQSVDLNDAVMILSYAYYGDPVPQCMDAADVNDNGLVDKFDASYLLYFLFRGAASPPPPFPSPGADPTNDRLDCPLLPPRLFVPLTEATLKIARDIRASSLTVTKDGKSAKGDVEGSIILRSGSADFRAPDKSAGAPSPFEVKFLLLSGSSLKVGTTPETGAITIRRQSSATAVGSYDPKTGLLSADVPVEVSYRGMLNFADRVVKEPDLKLAVKPMLRTAHLTGKVQSGGTIQAGLSFDLSQDAPILGSSLAQVNYSGPWTVGELELDPNLELSQVYRLKIGVVAANSSGTGAVISPADVSAVVGKINDIWRQCCVQFLALPEDPDFITYIPSGSFKGGDGDLFAVEDSGGFLGSDEEEFLWRYDADPEKIEVVFAQRFVSGGVDTFTVGATIDMGMPGAACIVETEKLTPEWIGRVLAHELGHALGIESHLDVPGNLMQPQLVDLNPTINEDQCLEARSDSPLPRLEPPCF